MREGAGVLIVWVDLDPAIEAEADRWYVAEHLPERVKVAGYQRSARYRAVNGSPAYMSVFEASTPAALASDGYRQITSAISPLSQRIRAGFRRCIRSTFQAMSSAGEGLGGTVLCARIHCPDETARAAFTGWAQREAGAWTVQRPEIIAAQVLTPARHVRERMDSFRATGQQDEWVDGALLLECARVEDALGLTEWLTTAWSRQFGASLLETATYQLMVDFSRAA